MIVRCRNVLINCQATGTGWHGVGNGDSIGVGGLGIGTGTGDAFRDPEFSAIMVTFLSVITESS